MTDSRVDEGNVEVNKTIDEILGSLVGSYIDFIQSEEEISPKEDIEDAKASLSKLLIEEVEKLPAAEILKYGKKKIVLIELDHVIKMIEELFG